MEVTPVRELFVFWADLCANPPQDRGVKITLDDKLRRSTPARILYQFPQPRIEELVNLSRSLQLFGYCHPGY